MGRGGGAGLCPTISDLNQLFWRPLRSQRHAGKYEMSAFIVMGRVGCSICVARLVYTDYAG